MSASTLGAWQIALRDRRAASQACPHWDYMNPSRDDEHPCCLALQIATQAVADAKAAHYADLRRPRKATEPDEILAQVRAT